MEASGQMDMGIEDEADLYVPEVPNYLISPKIPEELSIVLSLHLSAFLFRFSAE